MAQIELYMIRHGLAGERGTYANDDERPLTEEGIRRTRRVAKRLHALNIRFDRILTSPLARARQTAEILQTYKLGQLEESPHLAPGGDLSVWLSWLQQWRQSGGDCLAIVGHEPDLGEWAEILVWGKPQQHLILKKAGIIGLILPEVDSPIGRSQMFWLTPPRFFVD
ncbi:MAG: phosphohistidine phosphatase SixA [Leptolyngbya sp. IPPAS B-1204]|nr:phosphohistidine phosphatase SixA [Elainella sp. C42_A2020_010]RNJ67662.1 MAG: phosphohistidine phosphatase SixA [Leptolyngbya sp. IPPAS B-1204]